MRAMLAFLGLSGFVPTPTAVSDHPEWMVNNKAIG